MRVYILHHNCTPHGESAGGTPGSPPHNLHGCTVTVWEEFPIAWNNWTKCFAFKMFCFQNELAKWVVFHILKYRNSFFLVQNLIFINYRLRLLVQDFVWRKLFTSCNQNDHRIIRKAVWFATHNSLEAHEDTVKSKREVTTLIYTLLLLVKFKMSHYQVAYNQKLRNTKKPVQD